MKNSLMLYLIGKYYLTIHHLDYSTAILSIADDSRKELETV